MVMVLPFHLVDLFLPDKSTESDSICFPLQWNFLCEDNLYLVAQDWPHSHWNIPLLDIVELEDVVE